MKRECPTCKYTWEMIEPMDERTNAAWTMIENSYEIEPRSYFEKKYGAQALEIAIHYIWKRNPKVAAMDERIRQAELKGREAMREEAANIAQSDNWPGHSKPVTEMQDEIAAAIRVLPLEPIDKKEPVK